MAVPGVLGIIRRDRVPVIHRISAAGADLLARIRGLATHPDVVAPAPCASPRQRAAATRRWRNPFVAPAGPFGARAVPDGLLVSDHVPRRGDPWDTVFDFALTYDGHAYWDGLSELAAGVLSAWTRHESLPRDLGQLRACLFHEQRRWHHFGNEPEGRSVSYLWALLDAIREHPAVRAGALDIPTTEPLTAAEAAQPRHGRVRAARQGRVELLLGASQATDRGGPAVAQVYSLRSGAASMRAHPSVASVDSREIHPSNRSTRGAEVVSLEDERGARAFTRDDSRFRGWVTTHPDGYVLNVRRRGPSAGTLHRVGCAALRPSTRAGGADMPFVCASDPASIVAWTTQELGLSPTTCRRCRPG